MKNKHLKQKRPYSTPRDRAIRRFYLREFGITYDELRRRAREARLHPERLLSHDEVMDKLRAEFERMAEDQ